MYAARCAGNPILRNWKNVSSVVRLLTRSMPRRPKILRPSNPGKSRSSGILPNLKRSISAGELPSAPAKLLLIRIPRTWNGLFHPGCEPYVRGKALLQVRSWPNHPRRRARRLYLNQPPLQALPKTCQIGFRAPARLSRKMKKSPTGLRTCAVVSLPNLHAPNPPLLPKLLLRNNLSLEYHRNFLQQTIHPTG
jgi:hypothetical protein